MARPSAASSRIEPSETPANPSPSHSPQASRPSTARRLFCASSLRSSSASAAAASSSSDFAFGWLDEPSMRIAARRDSLLPPFSSIAAAVISSSGLTSGSASFSSAFLTSGRIDASAPPESSRAAASRSSRSAENSLSAASAPAMAPRSRLFATTSSRSAGSCATFSPVTASTPSSPRTIRTRLPEVCTSPSENACRSSAARGSPPATSAPIASIFSSLSPKASFSTAAGSSANAGDAASHRAISRMRICEKGRSRGPFSELYRLFLLFGHQRRLVLLLVVAGDERAPRLGLDRALGLPHHVELAVSLHFADEHRLVQVVVLLVHLGHDARGRLEGLAVGGDAHLVHVEALRLLDRLLPHVHADVRGFHRVVGERLAGVGELLRLGVGGPLLLPRVVLGVLPRHEVVPRREVADQRLGIEAAPLLLRDLGSDHRHVGRLQPLVAQLLVEGHVRVAVDGRDHRGLLA